MLRPRPLDPPVRLVPPTLAILAHARATHQDAEWGGLSLPASPVGTGSVIRPVSRPLRAGSVSEVTNRTS